MMKQLFVAGLLMGATFFTVETYAQQPQQPQQEKPRGDREGFFKKIDTDNDGKLSKAEVEAAAKEDKRTSRLSENFAAIDADKDGFLTKEELQAYRKANPPQGGPRQKDGGRK
ncbi:hypothetical protein [Chitinophaga sp. sic0106]|uniref:hypothetical protein n=1 Tax=Chitinophaga sp. sic0106 TaxID=2854785 RepID=UPI001C464B79|nr:hypothetical protein [Chitinophaga sp. sic0106]MBV7530177.1 hypothetical protein [Chitinophaga sp. sic0106]